MQSPKKSADPDSASTPTARRARADGQASRATILDAACRLATVRGIDGLSIGELAEHIGMSKSGLYAHFKSKEELQLAAIDTAMQIFQREVLDRVADSKGGIARILALTEAFLSHLERKVFPAGCFFATVAAQLAAQPGRPRDRIQQVQQMWTALFEEAVRQAIKQRELPRTTDLDQLVFEITSLMFRANFAWIMTEDKQSLEHVRAGVHNILARAAQTRPAK